jgi:streptomycin 6-kinase
VHWRGDIQDQNIIQSAVWMVIDPKNPDQPQLPADWHMAALFALLACLSFGAFLIGLL